jgi:glutamyl-tRNA reductase
MAVPRDFDTSLLTNNIEVYNIGDLQKYLDAKQSEVINSLPSAERIIEEEIELFQAWSEAQSNEVLAPIAEKLELCRQQFLEEYRRQYEQPGYDALDKFSRHLLHTLQSTFVKIVMNGDRSNEECSNEENKFL